MSRNTRPANNVGRLGIGGERANGDPNQMAVKGKKQGWVSGN